jgi:mannose-1-phosphate guanylyltransferase
VKAILLAAGRGERLRPLTDSIPKALVPIGGRPLLDYWLDLCETCGFTDVLVNTWYKFEMVEKFLRAYPRSLNIKTARETRLLGTAGTLWANWDFVAGEPVFLFAHADNYTNIDLRRFLKVFADSRKKQTVMAAALFRTTAPETCGIVRLDETRHIVEFHEKVQNPPGNLASGAIYLGTPKLADYLAPVSEATGGLDFSTQVVPKLMGRILGYEIDGFLADIGTPQQYETWKSGVPPRGS